MLSSSGSDSSHMATGSPDPLRLSRLQARCNLRPSSINRRTVIFISLDSTQILEERQSAITNPERRTKAETGIHQLPDARGLNPLIPSWDFTDNPNSTARQINSACRSVEWRILHCAFCILHLENW